MSSFPSLKTPTVLSQQELGNPVGKAFANRVGVFANSLALLAKHGFPVVTESIVPVGMRQKQGEMDSKQLKLRLYMDLLVC
jgi:hypothetical protein